MKLERFELERIQSEWEHIVEYNLSESGVEPLRVLDLLEDDDLQKQVLDSQLGYPQTNGSILLRERISDQYTGVDRDSVIVTNGGAEANFVALLWLIQGSRNRNELIMQMPNYMQLWGLGKTFGFQVKPFWLQNTGVEWTPDIEELKNAISKKTRLISICNPNNPTGAIMDSALLKTIAEIAEDAGVWILSDEVYQGTELDGKTRPSMLEFYDKVLVTNSLSKAYGLPGLRIGWVACHDTQVASDLWACTDYTSIAPSKLSDTLATFALQPDNRQKILARTRNILRKNWPMVGEWLQRHDTLFVCIAPQATAICLVNYNLDVNSVDLAHRLIHEKSVLIAPGDHFLMPGHIRIGYGHNPANLSKGLDLIGEMLQTET